MVERKLTDFPQYWSFQALAGITMTALALCACPLNAQERGDGGGEFAAMGGVTAGGLGTRPVLAGSVGLGFSRYIMGLVETTVIPLNDQTLIPTGVAQVKGSVLFDFNFALHVRIPIRKWEPYALFGTAVLMNPYTAGIAGPSGAVAYVGERHSKFGLELGAGCRYYVKDNWGVRAEYRYTSSTKDFNRVLGGVFYQMEGPSVFTFLPALARHLRK
jgi:Outer membrane protein beta-barrel domain